MDKLEYSTDNDKYKAPQGKNTKQRVLITNMESATNCTGKKLGTCQLPDNVTCYAECAEIQYPDCRPYRERQAKQWQTKGISWYSEQIKGIQDRARKKYTHHRLNESGEIATTNDMTKAVEIANRNEKIGIKTFIYTSRKDIFEQTKTWYRENALVVNGSGFMAHNEYRVVSEGYVAQENEYWCPDKCYNCRMCKERLGITILSKQRHVKKS